MDPAVYEKEEHKSILMAGIPVSPRPWQCRRVRIPNFVACVHVYLFRLRWCLQNHKTCIADAGGIMSVSGVCRRPARLLPGLPKHHAALAVRARLWQVGNNPISHVVQW